MFKERAARAALSISPAPSGLTARRWPGHAIPAAAVGLILLIAPAMALGHGGAYLYVEPTTISPGGAGAVRGAGFASGETVLLVLVTPTGDVPLGSVETDGEGSFAAVIHLPTDTAAGTRRLEGQSESHMEIVEVTIVGAPPEGGGDDRRDEEEPLLVPVSPGRAQGASAVPRPSPVKAVPVNQATGAQHLSRGIGIGVGGVILLAAIVGGLVTRQRRRPGFRDSASLDA